MLQALREGSGVELPTPTPTPLGGAPGRLSFRTELDAPADGSKRARRFLPPWPGPKERRARAWRDALAVTWLLVLGVAFLLPAQWLRHPVLSLTDGVFSPVANVAGEALTGALLGIASGLACIIARMRLCDIAHQDFLVHCTRVDQIQQAHDEGKVAWIAVIEGAAMIENEFDRIDLLYGFGVRSLGVTYSESNALGSGLKEPGDGGLTSFGRRAVARMNQLGMLIDCSHCGDQTTLDVIEVSDAPIILSHIGARALWDSNRLAPDSLRSRVKPTFYEGQREHRL